MTPRYFLLFAIILISYSAHSQNYVSLKEVILSLKHDINLSYRVIERNMLAHAKYDSAVQDKLNGLNAKINSIHRNLVKSHNEFKVGTVFSIVGVVTSIIGIAAKNGGVSYVGGGLSLTGWILHIDSHKFIGRGGMRKQETDVFKVNDLD